MDKTLKLWDVESGQELRTFFGHSGSVSSVAFSPDGKRALSGGGDNWLKLWDVETGRELRTFSGHTGFLSAVAFSPDGNRIISSGFDSTFKRTLSGGFDNTLKLWDVGSGQELRTFSGHTGFVSSVAFSPDGKQIISGGFDSTLKLWDVETGQELRTFSGHTGAVTSVAFSPDGKRIISGSQEGTVRLWDTVKGSFLAAFVNAENGEWVAITQSGYYVASANGDSLLNVRIGNEVYGVEQWRPTFDRPAMVQAALRGEQGSPKAVLFAASASSPREGEPILPPILRVETPADGATLEAATVQLRFHVEDRQRAIQTVTIAINGRRISNSTEASDPTIKIPSGRAVLDLEIPVQLERGDNLIEIVASNGVAETRRQLQVSALIRKHEGFLPVLWLLAIGINSYDNQTWVQPLHYAAADAEAIVGLFEQQKGLLFSDVHSLLITDNTDLKPTHDNIVDHLSFLRNAGAHDVAMLFVSGHGTNDSSGRFYLLPRDATFDESGMPFPSHGVSSADLHSVLDLPAKRLLMLDTCHAGDANGHRTKAPDTNQLVRELEGLEAVIFASSKGNEESQEDPAQGHGVFTDELLKGLRGMNGIHISAERTIYMKDLDAYVSASVPARTHGAQHPIIFAPEGYANFPIAVLK